MTPIERLIATATAEIGYLEKATNAQLDDKTANAGHGDWTKYARDLDALGVYNGKKNGYAWCDMFVDWCFIQTFGLEKAVELLCGIYYGAGCLASANYYKEKGRYHTSGPQAGDQVFFLNSAGRIGHTGIVVEVSGGKLWTIEGNTSSLPGVVDNGGCVRKKSYSLTYTRLAGFGRPDYSIIKDTEEEEENTMPIYKTLEAVPDSYRPTIEKLMKAGALVGYEDPDPGKLTDNIINVDETYCRVMTSLDRLGKLG